MGRKSAGMGGMRVISVPVQVSSTQSLNSGIKVMSYCYFDVLNLLSFCC